MSALSSRMLLTLTGLTLVVGLTVVRFAALGLVIVLSACTYSYSKEVTHSSLVRVGLIDEYRAARTSVFILPSGASVYITHPQSSARITRRIPRFRTIFQEAMLEVGRSRGFRGIVGEYQQSFHQAMNSAKVQGCDFVFTVVVTELESGNDQPRKDNEGFSLSMSVYDVRSQRLVDTFSVVADRGVSPQSRSPNELIYMSAALLIDRLYASPRA